MSSSTKITKHDLDDSIINSFSHKTYVATLTVSAWSNNIQTVSVSGVTNNNTVIVSPAPASLDDYGKGKVKCITQANGSLTFSCDTSKVPESNLTVNIVILGV